MRWAYGATWASGRSSSTQTLNSISRFVASLWILEAGKAKTLVDFLFTQYLPGLLVGKSVIIFDRGREVTQPTLLLETMFVNLVFFRILS